MKEADRKKSTASLPASLNSGPKVMKGKKKNVEEEEKKDTEDTTPTAGKEEESKVDKTQNHEDNGTNGNHKAETSKKEMKKPNLEVEVEDE